MTESFWEARERVGREYDHGFLKDLKTDTKQQQGKREGEDPLCISHRNYLDHSLLYLNNERLQKRRRNPSAFRRARAHSSRIFFPNPH